MLWFIIFGIIGALVMGILFWNIDGVEHDVPFTTFGVLLGAALGAIAAVVANFIACFWIHPVWYKADQWDLQSIGTGQQTHGAFFLGIGSIDGYQVYNYFAKVGPNDYQEAQAYTDDSTIHESTGTPHVEYWKQKSPNTWLGLFADGTHESYEFYVPRGSVKQTYVLKP